MTRDSLDDLDAFFAVAREGSFTRAAARLGVTQSALSQTVRALETRLGLQLLTRTTRSVSPTDAGERLVRNVQPRLEEIRQELAELDSLREKPAGTVRISASEHAADTVLWPALSKFLPAYPDIQIEVIVDNGMIDIVTERCDAGVRLGDVVAKDMIAIPISGQQQMIVVGAPSYFLTNPAPKAPRDLVDHRCINFRLPTHGGLYVWEFAKRGRDVNVRVEGQVVFNRGSLVVRAALDGLGLAYHPIDEVQPHIEEGRLVPVLKDWSPPYPGYRLYYPSRRRPTAAFALVAQALRFKEK